MLDIDASMTWACMSWLNIQHEHQFERTQMQIIIFCLFSDPLVYSIWTDVGWAQLESACLHVMVIIITLASRAHFNCMCVGQLASFTLTARVWGQIASLTLTAYVPLDLHCPL